jgi:hypothetical protein
MTSGASRAESLTKAFECRLLPWGAGVTTYRTWAERGRIA